MSLTEKAAAMAKVQKAAPKVAPTPEPAVVTGPEIPMAIHTPEATVVVYGHHLMSKRDVELLAMTLTNDGWDGKSHGVRIIRFLDDRRPVGKDGQPVFASCSVELGGVLINLQHHFNQAVALSESEPERSVWANYMQMLIQSYLHEASHISARLTEEDRDAMAKEDAKDEENLSEQFSFDMLIHMAKTLNIEPGSYTQSPFFVRSWNKLITKEGVNAEWLEKQQHLLENNISYELLSETVPEGYTLNTFKAYIQLQSEDHDSEDWNKPTPDGDVINSICDAVGTQPVVGAATVANANTDDLFGMGDGPETYTAEEFGFQPEMPPVGQPNTAVVAQQTGPAADVFPKNGLTPQQIGQVMQGVYSKIYNHIFGNCQQLLNSDMPFGRPEAVAEIPIMLTDQEKAVVVKCRCQTPMGQIQDNVYLGDGALRGFVSSKAKLPMYKLHLNIDGKEEIRLVMPQNTAKQNGGNYSQTALAARGGSRILFVMEGNDLKTQAGAKKYLLKIVDGQLQAC